MSKISGKETKPEVMVRKFFFSKSLRYRKNVNTLPGKPDVVLSKHKTVIFVQGCFWHGHKRCKAAMLPETRKYFWEKKISDNINRDKRNITKLKKRGWKVINIWQCQISNKKKMMRRLEAVVKEMERPNDQ